MKTFKQMSELQLMDTIDDRSAHPMDRIEAAIELYHRQKTFKDADTALAIIQNVIDEYDQEVAEREQYV